MKSVVQLLLSALFLIAQGVSFAEQAKTAKSYDPRKLPMMQDAIERINGAVARRLTKEGIPYNVRLNDHVFLRRIYLDLAGTIPTHDQIQTFVRSGDPYKRTRLINELLASEDFVSHTYNYFADLLRIQSTVPGEAVRLDAFSYWLKDSIRQNKPYAWIVQEMISATGSIEENPAAGYHLRDTGMKLDHVSFMTKIFISKDITCAQCHDHPFEDWTQMDYYSLAAFLGEMETKGKKKPSNRTGNKNKTVRVSYTPEQLTMRRFLRSWKFEVALAKKQGVSYVREKAKVQKDARAMRDAFDGLITDSPYSVRDSKGLSLKLPDDYQYEDADPGDEVKPKVLLGTVYSKSRSMPKREQLANWIANTKNRWFALTIANRMWARFFGRGVAEPLHDVAIDDVPNPELLKVISDVMQDLDYDLKAFSWVLTHTDAYNRLATQVTVPVKQDYHFPGPLLRRMSAEQVWDSFVTLMVDNPLRYRTAGGLSLKAVSNQDEAISFVQELVEKKGVKVRKGQSLKPRLVLLDSETGETVFRGDEGLDATDAPSMQRITTGSGKEKLILVRASELEQPSPPGHFLRRFGQSERTFVVGASNLAGSVPQVMELMNGFATEAIIRPDSMLFRKIKNETNTFKRAEIAFLSILGREATKSERVLLLKQLHGGKDQDMGDLIWALINTPEFFFVK